MGRRSMRTLILGVLLVLAPTLCASAVDMPAAAKPIADALPGLTPDGYTVTSVLPLTGTADRNLFVVGLSDINRDVPTRAATLLLVARRQPHPVLEDNVTLHDPCGSACYTPNYLGRVNEENVGTGRLLFVWSAGSAGGSGASHYYDFYRVENGKLRLVRSFKHGRMDRFYFAIYKNAIYDSEVECKRGEKHGRAYIYTCGFKVTKYLYDGNSIAAVASETCRARQGNRYLGEEYRTMSVRSALQQGEVFRDSK